MIYIMWNDGVCVTKPDRDSEYYVFLIRDEYSLFCQENMFNTEMLRELVYDRENDEIWVKYAESYKQAAWCNNENDEENTRLYLYQFASQSRSAWAWNLLGYKCLKSDIQYAEGCFRYAMELGDEYAEHNLAMCLLMQDNTNDAVEYLKDSERKGQLFSTVLLFVEMYKANNLNESIRYYKTIKNNNDYRIEKHDIGDFLHAYIEHTIRSMKNDSDFDKLLCWYRMLAELDCSIAAYELGLIYAELDDERKSFYYMLKSSANGNVMGMAQTARSYYYGIGCAKNYRNAFIKACMVLKQCEDTETPDWCKAMAQRIIGLVYYYNYYLKSDDYFARSMLESAHELESDEEEGCYELACCYRDNRGVELRNYSKAIELAKTAAKSGKNPYAYSLLGDMYCAGQGCNANKQIAGNYYKHAFELCKDIEFADLRERVSKKLDNLIVRGEWNDTTKKSKIEISGKIKESLDSMKRFSDTGESMHFAIEIRVFITYVVNDLLDIHGINNVEEDLFSKIELLKDKIPRTIISSLHNLRKVANEYGAHRAETSKELSNEEMETYLHSSNQILEYYSRYIGKETL